MTLWRGVDIFGRPGYPRYPLLPGRPGHEMAGTVVDVGKHVSDLAVGDRVASIFDSGESRPGFYADYAIARPRQLLRLPDDVRLADATSLELAQCVSVCFQRAGNLEGLRVGIGGLGPAGLLAAQIARARGAAAIIGFEVDATRAALALSLGVDRVVDPASEEGRELAALPPERQLDLSIECAGAATSIENLLNVTRSRVLLFGVPHGTFQFSMAAWAKGVQLEGYNKHNRAAGEFALELIASGKLRLAPLFSARLPFSRYADGVALLLQRKALKVLFVPEGEA